MRDYEPNAFIRPACLFVFLFPGILWRQQLTIFLSPNKNMDQKQPPRRWPEAKNPPGPSGSGWTHFRGSIERGEVVGSCCFFSASWWNVITPWKIKMELKNGGLEDYFPFQWFLGSMWNFQIFVCFFLNVTFSLSPYLLVGWNWRFFTEITG